jgi:hypothetical protein
MSNHIGKISHDISVNITITGFISRKHWENNKKIFIATDVYKNIITFNSNISFPVGQTWNISGKVKRHNTFNGQNQTHIKDWYLSLC